ncbi:MAG: calcium/sodium antiporter [Vicingus serpentipes]|nr:calcium/sodium antiporter [Vicingus serpentipes]
MEYVLLIIGLIVLVVAGELLVRGAVGLALKFKISPLVIGMTIVSTGTSAPELLVSIRAAIDGHPELAIGNVLGSNIANLALVLGLSTMLLPIAINRTTKTLDWPIMLLASVLFYLFGLNRNFDWWEGLIYVLGLVTFNFYLFWKSMRDNKSALIDDVDLEEDAKLNLPKSIIYILIGIVGLTFGAKWLLNGAVDIATNFGVTEHIIGVTIIAFGTSIPELITSVMAALKKQTDISVGNLIGSNIFNLMAVLGITSLIKEIPISDQVMQNDVFWMLGIALLLFPLMAVKNRIGRLSGAILFASYCIYIYFVVS